MAPILLSQGIVQSCTPPEKNAHPPTFREKVSGRTCKQALRRPFPGPPRACYRSMVFTKPAKKDFVQKIAHPSDTLWYQNGCAALEIVAYFDEKRTYLRFFVKTFAHR